MLRLFAISFCFYLQFSFFVNDLMAEEYCIAFVHIGDSIPNHAKYAFKQARIFNPTCPIILVANERAIAKFEPFPETHLTLVACENLEKSVEHTLFEKRTTLDKKWREGFWCYASERFLYLHDLMSSYNLKNVFHLENDNLLYADLSEILDVFENYYSGVAATFEMDNRCIPGFIYFRDEVCMEELAKCFARYATKGWTDMELIARFKNEYGKSWIDSLPILPFEYVEKHELVTKTGERAYQKTLYYNNIPVFQSLFDASSMGQWLGGQDPRNGPCHPGHICEYSVVRPDFFSFDWLDDEQGRKVLYAIYKGRYYRMNNLHVHSKKLYPFASF